MGRTKNMVVAPALAVVSALGVAGVAGVAGAAVRPAHGTFALVGKVARIEAKTGRFELQVGKKDLSIGATAMELKTLKVGETVGVQGHVVHNLRMADVVTPRAMVSKPAAKPAKSAKTSKTATKGSADFDLVGKVTGIDAKTDRFEVEVGKKDLSIGATAMELKTLKVGETVAMRGHIVHNLRMATSLKRA